MQLARAKHPFVGVGIVDRIEPDLTQPHARSDPNSVGLAPRSDPHSARHDLRMKAPFADEIAWTRPIGAGFFAAAKPFYDRFAALASANSSRNSRFDNLWCCIGPA